MDKQRPPARWLSERGFTLIEFLVALTLLGLLLPVAFAAVRQGTAIWQQVDTDTDSNDQVHAARTFLQRELTQAYPAYLGASPAPTIDFDGRHDGLRFLAPVPAALGPGGLARYDLTTAPGAAGRDLVLQWQWQLATTNNRETPVRLLEGVDQVEVSYFGSTGTQDTPAWRPEWRSPPRLPELIAIRVTFPPGDRRRWPALVVAPAIELDAACIYDPLTKGCRGR